MKKLQVNRLLVAGWIMFAIARIAIYSFSEPNNLLHAFNGFAIGLVIAGASKQVLSHHGIKLRQWKLRVIGK